MTIWPGASIAAFRARRCPIGAHAAFRSTTRTSSSSNCAPVGSGAARAARLVIGFAALALIGGAAKAGEPDAARRGELRYLLEQDCGSCHGLTRKGGLGTALLPEFLAPKSDAALARIILEGIPGTPMPPWRYLISAEDAAYLVKLLRVENGHGD